MPIQQPIPIWFGGYNEKVLRRVGRLGDGWLPGHREAEKAKPDLEILEETAIKAGRDPKDIGLEPRLNYQDGDPDVWNKIMEGWREVGATHMSLNTMYIGLYTPQKHIEAIKTFAKEMGVKP
jgi:alkanesulfonate monooxygenase SsuD/methylene tetrahydromethanopterin reductase-like flavin-dependent oxidoreductase (luciferase family)